MRLLLIEDDELLGGGLRDFLRVDGHAVEWARRLADVDNFRAEPFDAYLVDWKLADGSGLAWLSARRARGDTTPALMLTARDQLADRLHGLDSGADDYLVKPFAPEELVARVRAICRRSAGNASSRVHVGIVDVDLLARCAWLGGERIELTSREWSVLEALALRPGRIVAKTELEQIVLGFQSELASNAIEVHVSSLRRKLGREVVETVRGMGYRLGAVA
jgi:two-component system, OmpR family, response regulator